jgi:hypothetical protein
VTNTSPQSPPSESTSALPLFYRDPQLISSATHADWRLKPGDVSFARDAIAVPIVVGEFTATLRNFPILFAAGGGEVGPIALLGLDRSNLFVADGTWSEGTYVPAYVRRYPFGFIAHRDGFALGIDVACERIVRSGDEGTALFENGKPADLTRQALRFCDAYRAEAAATRDFCQALQSKQLLIDRRADATLPNGRKLGLDGFQIIDAPKLARLDTGSIAEWHHKGWLALAHFHLASLDRFEDLLVRRGARDNKKAGTQAGAGARS